MTKEDLLQNIQNAVSQGIISKEELLAALEITPGVKAEGALSRKLGATDILYYIGGGVVFIGIAILVGQNWESLSGATKLLATLGAGVVAYIVGLLLGRNEHTEMAGSAFYFISALTLPLGLYVMFNGMGFDIESYPMQTLISAILLGVFLSSYFLLKKTLFLIFSILYATWLFYALIGYIVGSNPILETWQILQYETLFVGLAYILLGYSFSQGDKAPLSGFLYGFGILGFLGAAMALGGFYPNHSIVWELIFPVLVFATIFLSVKLKSRSFLVFGSIFLMGYILKITAEYFSEGLGWPLALVIAGLLLIAVAYASVYVKKRYFPGIVKPTLPETPTA
ncbi:hypothetical protein A2807_02530 [Candidatus Berkelbacteria bacterium RIFCSPHIGHO2_01_FULL_50_36]|nr:MAG: hypothetical protein A2807_02530 [Candidatus Berkelbacteria bacterium RIFCSPHIGHO2_01_FULL_50_36]OGD62675.1 MAG: hypothetical protein A3F39_00545 [Candidatus Berkelbacteria bacterium RIFCSPHIGHO2_12_FULL_50_11]